MKKAFLFIALVFILTSCKKDEEPILEFSTITIINPEPDTYRLEVNGVFKTDLKTYETVIQVEPKRNSLKAIQKEGYLFYPTVFEFVVTCKPGSEHKVILK